MSDPSNIIASPHTTLDTRQVARPLEAIVDIARREEVGTVVVGYPYHTDGGLTPKAKMVDIFIEALQAAAPDLKVERSDERFTTVAAQGLLGGRNKKIRSDKGAIDRFAAAIILQDYLNEAADSKV